MIVSNQNSNGLHGSTVDLIALHVMPSAFTGEYSRRSIFVVIYDYIDFSKKLL
jgi:hypothetical protein